MLIKFPKDDNRYHWTRHIKNKMMFYGLPESRIKKVLNAPRRIEEGIAENTLAAMQPGTSKKRPEEIWVMYQQLTNNKKLKTLNDKLKAKPKLLISAWRYPGVSKPGARIPIPVEIEEELAGILK